MEFLDNLGKTFSEVARQVEAKSEELIETGRLNIEIFKEEDAIRRLNRKIGELIYSHYIRKEDYGGKADELCAEICERKKKIKGLRARIKEIRSAKGESKANTGEEREAGSKDTGNDSSKADDGEESKGTKADNQTSEGYREPDIPYYTAVQMLSSMKEKTAD